MDFVKMQLHLNHWNSYYITTLRYYTHDFSEAVPTFAVDKTMHITDMGVIILQTNISYYTYICNVIKIAEV
jgi:hypothetical protein